MAACITLAGESLKAQKQGAHEALEITHFVLANVPGLDPIRPIDRAAGLPPAEQIVGTWAYTQKGYIDPNRVVYSLMLGSDIGDFDWNWIGLTTAEGVLFAVSSVPVQQKRRNIPPLQAGNNVTRNFLVAFDGAQELTGITVEAATWQHDFTSALAAKLGRSETAAAAFKLPMLDLRDSSDLYGPPSALHGKGTITGFTNGALLGIPGLNSTDYGVAELSGQWTDVSGVGGAAQRVFRTHAGRQFYQHQEGAADVWSKWYETQNIGAAARSQNRTEVLNVAIADTVPGLTIYTKIPAGPALMPALRITGGLSSYTSPVEILVSWYFYEGAVYMPTALVNAAGERPTVSVGVHNGMIAVQLSFAGGEAYIPRLAVEAINFDGYAVAAEYLQGWTYSWALEPLSGLVACEQRNVINDKTLRQLAPGLDGTGAHGTWPISIGGYAEYAGVTGRSAYLNWTAHGGHGSGDGSHVVFDASIGLAPNGAPIGSVDPSVAWTPGLPTMMGWNGGATYGVRVDRARHAEALTHDIIINGVHLNAGSNVSLSAPAAGGTADAANLLNNRIPLPYSALPKDYPLGVSSMFVGPESGWPHYGTVLTVRGYAEGGGTLQIYSPYGTEFGGGRVLTRYGNYTAETGGNAWSGWSGNAGEGYSGVFGTTGYRMFPDGTMFQWGTALVPTNGNVTHATVVNLPAAYPVANHFAMASWNAPPFSAALGQCGARPNGNNSIVITSGGAIVGPFQVNWYSIGQWKVA